MNRDPPLQTRNRPFSLNGRDSVMGVPTMPHRLQCYRYPGSFYCIGGQGVSCWPLGGLQRRNQKCAPITKRSNSRISVPQKGLQTSQTLLVARYGKKHLGSYSTMIAVASSGPSPQQALPQQTSAVPNSE